MRRRRASVATALLLAAVALPASIAVRAAERALLLRPEATKVAFTLDATAHQVHGTVPVTSGSLRFDLAGGAVSGEVVLDLKGARTGNERRDRDMHAKVLETARHPRAVFRARRLEGTVAPLGTSKVTLHGVLNLHGADHEVKLPATVKIAGGRVTADATLTIPYVAWGMTDPSKFVLRVGKTVDVSVHVEGTLGG